jgi:hypothetical protein
LARRRLVCTGVDALNGLQAGESEIVQVGVPMIGAVLRGMGCVNAHIEPKYILKVMKDHPELFCHRFLTPRRADRVRCSNREQMELPQRHRTQNRLQS